MATFYQRLFKMHRSDQGRLESHDLNASLVFLTRDPSEHHQLVLIDGKPEDMAFNVINQISFRVDTLSELREFWNYLDADSEVDKMYAATHGNAWSIYFFDPENNRIEVYLDTPWYVKQPFRGDLDLSLTDEEIIDNTRELVHANGIVEPIERWQQKIAERIGLKDWGKRKKD